MFKIGDIINYGFATKVEIISMDEKHYTLKDRQGNNKKIYIELVNKYGKLRKGIKMGFDTLKMSIEDNAFTMWDCNLPEPSTYEESAKIFVKKYLEDYPGFQEHWTAEELTKQLMERL